MTFETFHQSDEETWHDQQRQRHSENTTTNTYEIEVWNCWHFRQLRTWVHDNHCYLGIKSDTGQHSQFLRCFVHDFSSIMTRFESDYNPEIIYDASCRVKEYGLNRELKRFMSIRITTDEFHQVNHKSCSASFRSSKYVSLEKVNSEACEQTNSVLRKIASSTTYMSPSLYMRVLTLFMANLNIIANNKK